MALVRYMRQPTHPTTWISSIHTVSDYRLKMDRLFPTQRLTVSYPTRGQD